MRSKQIKKFNRGFWRSIEVHDRSHFSCIRKSVSKRGFLRVPRKRRAIEVDQQRFCDATATAADVCPLQLIVDSTHSQMPAPRCAAAGGAHRAQGAVEGLRSGG
jgi:hypothetical protein